VTVTPSTHSPRAAAAAAAAAADRRDPRVRLRDGTPVRLRRGAPLPAEDGATILAEDAAGQTVGRAAYTRIYGARAEVLLTVDDAFWPRGLPRVLLIRLSAAAARVEILTFLARVPPSDARLLALLCRDFAATRTATDDTHVPVEFATFRPSA
jgi:hypothetical protein